MDHPTPASLAPALLKSTDGRLLEVGQVSLSAEDGHVDFHSEFVQLFKMGTKLTVVQVAGETEIIRFSGQVYLSAQNMLRLVDVSQEILPGAAYACVFPVSMTGTVRAVQSSRNQPLLQKMLRKPPAEETFAVNIHSISMEEIRFTASQVLAAGQTIRMNLPELGADSLTLGVAQVFAFGQGLNNYQCRLAGTNTLSRASLERLVTQICRQQLSFFPEG